MSDNSPTTVINIISTAYSGSTWLGLMLGTHPQMLSVGEMKWVRRDPDNIACGLHGEECPLWSRFDWHAEENPFCQLVRLSGYRTLVVHNSRKLVPHQRTSGARAKFIHLIRDGRAVTASMLRKNCAPSMWGAARLWRYKLSRHHRMLKRQPSEDCLTVQYESLVADKHAELSRICEFLGAGFDPAMLEFWEGDYHPISGNRGTIFTAARRNESAKRGRAEEIAEEATRNQQADVNYYQQQDPKQFQDERWKSELSDRDLRLFGLVAGRLNRRFGYPRSLDRESSPVASTPQPAGSAGG